MQAWDDLNQLSVQESAATHVVVTASGSDRQGWQLTGYGGTGGVTALTAARRMAM